MNRRMWLKSLCGGAAAVMWPWGRAEKGLKGKVATYQFYDEVRTLPETKGSVFYWACTKDEGDWHDPKNWHWLPAGQVITLQQIPFPMTPRLDRDVPGEHDTVVFTPGATGTCIISDDRKCDAVAWYALADIISDDPGVARYVVTDAGYGRQVIRVVHPGSLDVNRFEGFRPTEDEEWVEWQVSANSEFGPEK